MLQRGRPVAVPGPAKRTRPVLSLCHAPSHRCAYGLSVEQTPPSDKTSEPQGTRIDAYLEQLQRVVCDHHPVSSTGQALGHLRYVIADGYYSKRKFLDGLRALGLHPIGKLRRDANPRFHEDKPALSLPRTGALGTGASQDPGYQDLCNYGTVTDRAA